MYIRNSSNENDWVLDPFGGSASTLLAALTENRKCMTIEIDEKYVPKMKERVTYFLKNGKDIRMA